MSYEEAKKKDKGYTEVHHAEILGVCKNVVQRAVSWSRKQVFNISDPSLLAAHILSLKEHIKKYEKLQDAILAETRVKSKTSRQEKTRKSLITGNTITGLGRVILEYKTRVMELEGLYKQVVNIDHGGFVPRTFAEWVKYNANGGENGSGISE